MSSVFLSLSLSMFVVAHALRSHIHNCMESSRSDILLGAEIRSCESSTNEWCVIECESVMADKGQHAWRKVEIYELTLRNT